MIRLQAWPMTIRRRLASAWRGLWGWSKQNYATFDKVLGTMKNIATTALAVAAFVYACFWNSHTTFRVGQVTSDAIKLNVMTKAPPLKQSYVRNCRIHFEGLDIEDAELVPADPDLKESAVISPDKPKIIALTVAGFRGRCRNVPVAGRPDRVTKSEIRGQITNGYATLTLFVEEANDGENGQHSFSRRIRAEQLRPLIERKLPDDIPEKTSC